MLTDPLAPQPMTPAEVADLVRRAREATQRAVRHPLHRGADVAVVHGPDRGRRLVISEGTLLDLETRIELWPQNWPHRRIVAALRLIRHGREDWYEACGEGAERKEIAT